MHAMKDKVEDKEHGRVWYGTRNHFLSAVPIVQSEVGQKRKQQKFKVTKQVVVLQDLNTLRLDSMIIKDSNYTLHFCVLERGEDMGHQKSIHQSNTGFQRPWRVTTATTKLLEVPISNVSIYMYDVHRINNNMSREDVLKRAEQYAAYLTFNDEYKLKCTPTPKILQAYTTFFRSLQRSYQQTDHCSTTQNCT